LIENILIFLNRLNIRGLEGERRGTLIIVVEIFNGKRRK
jgi:hypothetical protein